MLGTCLDTLRAYVQGLSHIFSITYVYKEHAKSPRAHSLAARRTAELQSQRSKGKTGHSKP